MIKNLSLMPYAQAHVVYYDTYNFTLYSYKTAVIEVVNGWFYINGLYSATTRKHISAFMREYFTWMDFYDAKKLYQDGEKINIYTGEVLPINEKVTI